MRVSTRYEVRLKYFEINALIQHYLLMPAIKMRFEVRIRQCPKNFLRQPDLRCNRSFKFKLK